MKTSEVMVAIIAGTMMMLSAAIGLADTTTGPKYDQDHGGYMVTNVGNLYAGTGTFTFIVAGQQQYTASGTNIDMHGNIIFNLSPATTSSGAVNLIQLQTITGDLHTAIAEAEAETFANVTNGMTMQNTLTIYPILTNAKHLVLNTHYHSGNPYGIDLGDWDIAEDGYNLVFQKPSSVVGNLVFNDGGGTGIDPLIKGVGTPEDGTDVANKNYVNTGDLNNSNYVAAVAITTFANVTNGMTMEGGLVIDVPVTNVKQLVLNTHWYSGNPYGLDLGGWDIAEDGYNLKIKKPSSVVGNLIFDDGGGTGIDPLIKGIGTPTEATDAANKAYVNAGDLANSNDVATLTTLKITGDRYNSNYVAATAITTYANVTNGMTMLGDLNMGPANDGNDINRAMNVGLFIPAGGGTEVNLAATASGELVVTNESSTGYAKVIIGTPTVANHAVTKAYADGIVHGATNQYNIVSWSVASPSTAEVSAVTLQLKNSAGVNLSGYYLIDMWTSTNTYGFPVDYTDTNIFTIGKLLKENTANAYWTLQSSSTGTVSVTFTRNTDGVLHVMYTSPVLKGKIYATTKTWLAP